MAAPAASGEKEPGSIFEGKGGHSPGLWIAARGLKGCWTAQLCLEVSEPCFVWEFPRPEPHFGRGFQLLWENLFPPRELGSLRFQWAGSLADGNWDCSTGINSHSLQGIAGKRVYPGLISPSPPLPLALTVPGRAPNQPLMSQAPLPGGKWGFGSLAAGGEPRDFLQRGCPKPQHPNTPSQLRGPATFALREYPEALQLQSSSQNTAGTISEQPKFRKKPSSCSEFAL